jgi:hypothetical protein
MPSRGENVSTEDHPAVPELRKRIICHGFNDWFGVFTHFLHLLARFFLTPNARESTLKEVQVPGFPMGWILKCLIHSMRIPDTPNARFSPDANKLSSPKASSPKGFSRRVNRVSRVFQPTLGAVFGSRLDQAPSLLLPRVSIPRAERNETGGAKFGRVE